MSTHFTIMLSFHSFQCFSSRLRWRKVLFTVLIVATTTSRFTTTVIALPAGFQDEAIAYIPNTSTLHFAPKQNGQSGHVLYAAIKEGRVQVMVDWDTVPSVGGELALDRSVLALDLQDQVCHNGERGIHQIISHPEFGSGDNQHPFVYISYTHLDSSGGCGLSSETGAVNRLSKFRVRGDYTINRDSEQVLLETNPLQNSIHNGGDMFFGKDGYLYLTIGDGGDGLNAQDRGNLLGTVVRLTDNGDIPPENPFVGRPLASRCHQTAQPGKLCLELFNFGLRNPYRMAMDPNYNDNNKTQFYIGDVGGSKWEEISQGGTNFGGANYGWNTREGPCLRDSYTDCPPSGSSFMDPIYWYGHDGSGAAVVGIAVVPDQNLGWPASYNGAILYMEFVQGELYVIHNDATPCNACDSGRPRPAWSQTLFHDLSDSNLGRPVDLSFGPYQGDRQALYYTVRRGLVNIRRITYRGGTNNSPIARISTEGATSTSPIVYAQAGESILFDGSGSYDPDEDDLEYIWDFGDGTITSTSQESTIRYSYSESQTRTVTLTVRDPSGFFGTAYLRVTTGTLPIVKITSPPPGTKFAVGDIFTLMGSADDVITGESLPDSSLSWEVRKHHNTHFHPFLDATTGNQIVTDPAPSPEDVEAAKDSFLEVLLTATGANGSKATVTRLIFPQMVELSIESTPPGMKMLVDGSSVTTPVSVASWINHQMSIVAQDQDEWYFQKWSDGVKSRDHAIAVGSGSSTYRAIFAPCPVGPCEEALNPTPANAPQPLLPLHLEIMLRGFDRIIYTSSETDVTRTYHEGKCQVHFARNGQIRAFGNSVIPWSPNNNSLCRGQSNPSMTYELQDDGNFVARCHSQVDYSSHTHSSTSANYFMAIDSRDCGLHIYQGSLMSDSLRMEELWSSHLYEPMKPNDRLYSGQILQYQNIIMVLDSSDGNLQVKTHQGLETLWESSDEWDAPPPSYLDEFYAKLTANGHLQLVGIDYGGSVEIIYFDKDLDLTNTAVGECFALGYSSALGLALVAARCEDGDGGSLSLNLDIVLRAPDGIVSTDTATTVKKTYQEGQCEVSFAPNGEIRASNPISSGSVAWSPNDNSLCRHGQDGLAMTYQLQGDGNFVASCGSQVDYSSHTHSSTSANYFMAIDDVCGLHIYQGSWTSDSLLLITQELWASHLYGPMKPNDRLISGQILQYQNTIMVLDSSDGNLQVKTHQGLETLWESSSEWDAPPPSNMRDFYAKLTANGHLLLVGIDYGGPVESIYFDKDLHLPDAVKGECFTLEYDRTTPDFLVAIACNGDAGTTRRRIRHLRAAHKREGF